ncbi:MAG: malate synthase A [Thermoplasmata archaeon]
MTAAFEVHAPATYRQEEVLTPAVLELLGTLHDLFEGQRQELLQHRGAFREGVRVGRAPTFPSETAATRSGEWKVAPPPDELRDRRVEITGPVDRKMVINALNSGANVYMADFEDAHAPTWAGTIAGQANLIDAVRRRIEYVAPEGREYRLDARTSALMVRPRGWHLTERHLTVGGRPISASLFDFAVYFQHNAREQVSRGAHPCFYLPKLEHYREARLWNDVLSTAEEAAGLRTGTARATVLIETLPAAFQMDEILYELRDHSLGLNCGRWDYLFSFIKQYRDDPSVRFPDRAALSMGTPFLSAYSRLLIQTCHRRGAHAMGGMAAQVPIRDDPGANERALAFVRADKEREVRAGHDGTWVAHPALVRVAREVFDAGMKGPNQIDVARFEPPVAPSELLRLPEGPVTGEGVRRNTRVAVRYLDAWFRGIGCVPIDHLMEDAATVEIARCQLWQWIHHGAVSDTGAAIDAPLFRRVLEGEVAALRAESGRSGSGEMGDRAARLLERVVTAPTLEEFITVSAYAELEDRPQEGG